MLIADLDYLEETTQAVTGGVLDTDFSDDENANIVLDAISQFNVQEITGDGNNQQNTQVIA